ncbi:hypothetical protein HMPREF1093_00206 [Hungatella hathewayi 12489931]|uniref:ABC transporter permease n=1 Tax=Hungatella hathewayi TaxID=154046 RepID=UPI0002D1947B|nr:ABC transporter permease subunit [Hungatella hathewayi]ENY98996.1 hypothetical protein HMPREF1093_00206 [Hungatella hathewayi 12489931]
MGNSQIIKGQTKGIWGKLKYDLWRYKFVYFLMIPGLLLLLIFSYYPLYFLQIAFKKYTIYTGLEGAVWCGLDNFKRLFETRYFLQAIKNTFIISFMKIIIGFPMPIILALLLNEIRSVWFKKGIQTIVYLPHFLSWVIVASIWINILSPEGGIVNEFLVKVFHIDPIFFMADKSVFRWVVVAADVWKETGWGTIIYLAALTGIDLALYESARVDGANRLQQILHITLPSILPVILVVFILGLAKVLNIFDQVFVMYNPVVAEVAETIDTYVYQIGMVNGDIAFATAVGLFKNIISLVLVLGTNWISKKIQGVSVID